MRQLGRWWDWWCWLDFPLGFNLLQYSIALSLLSLLFSLLSALRSPLIRISVLLLSLLPLISPLTLLCSLCSSCLLFHHILLMNLIVSLLLFPFSFFSSRCWSHWCRILHGFTKYFDAVAACDSQRHSSPLFKCDIVFLLHVSMVLHFSALWNSSSFFLFMTLQLRQLSSSASLLPVLMRCHCFRAMTVACCKWARQLSDDVMALSALSQQWILPLSLLRARQVMDTETDSAAPCCAVVQCSVQCKNGLTLRICSTVKEISDENKVWFNKGVLKGLWCAESESVVKILVLSAVQEIGLGRGWWWMKFERRLGGQEESDSWCDLPERILRWCTCFGEKIGWMA